MPHERVQFDVSFETSLKWSNFTVIQILSVRCSRFEFHILGAWTNNLDHIPSRCFLKSLSIWLGKQKTDADRESKTEWIQKLTLKFHHRWNLPKSFLDSTRSTEFFRRRSQKCMLQRHSSWPSSLAQQTILALKEEIQSIKILSFSIYWKKYHQKCSEWWSSLEEQRSAE